MTIFKKLSDYFVRYFSPYQKKIIILLFIFLFLIFPKQKAYGAGICTNQEISPIVPGTGNISIDSTQSKFTISFEIEPGFAELNKRVFFTIAGSTRDPGSMESKNFIGDTKTL